MSSPVDPPKDLVAAFHTSFHFTQGNVLDWSTSIDQFTFEKVLDGVEFSSLPSGLHTVENDVVYFKKGGYDAVAVFSRFKTADKTEGRGYQMEAFGVLLEDSAYPTPWLHATNLKSIHSASNLDVYFQSRRTAFPCPPTSEPSPIDWTLQIASPSHPLNHLPHLLRIIGPSYFTIFKSVLARKRVMIYTQAPVEASCILAKVCADVAWGGETSTELERPKFLGMIGLTDMDVLKKESGEGRGWIACTTDALYLERPNLYDLVVDMTTVGHPLLSSSHSTGLPPISRPNLLLSRPSPSSPNSAKLSQVRFTFSDIRLWTVLSPLLAHTPHSVDDLSTPNPVLTRSRTWNDVLPWKLGYEDVCVVCASFWTSSSTNRPLRLQGEDEALYINREASRSEPLLSPPPRKRTPIRRASSSSKSNPAPPSPRPQPTTQAEATLAILQFFHSQARFWNDALEPLVDRTPAAGLVVLTPADLGTMRLSALSELDSRFVEWLAEGRYGRKVSVMRGWREMVSALVGW